MIVLSTGKQLGKRMVYSVSNFGGRWEVYEFPNIALVPDEEISNLTIDEKKEFAKIMQDFWFKWIEQEKKSG